MPFAYALRLIFDPTLPDSARQLGFADFWDELGKSSVDDKITVTAKITDSEDDSAVPALSSDFWTPQ